MPVAAQSFVLLDARRAVLRSPRVARAAWVCELVCSVTLITFLTLFAYVVGKAVF